MTARSPAPRSQAGQAFVLVAIIMLTFLTGIGVAFDASYDYYYSVQAGRAAAAATLAGVVFMPGQLTYANAVTGCTPAENCDATDRAVAEAKRNGFDVNDTANSVKVIPAAVPGQSSELQVTVSRSVPTLFMRLFGFSSFTVSQTAIASYLPPISLGQSGGQIGSAVSQLGQGSNYYFMREFGYAAHRSEGDAFGPDPSDGGALSPPSTDVHQFSGSPPVGTGVDTVDSSLPARGGYNYQITVPTGTNAYIQVYNAVFGPDGIDDATSNHCDNNRGWTACSAAGSSYYLHEQDGIDFSTASTFDAMEYTLYRVTNVFVRSSDTMRSQFIVRPIDATSWSKNKNQYLNVNTNAKITQAYNLDGTPSNMGIYHNWVNVTDYDGTNDGGLIQGQVKYTAGTPTGTVPAGTYRLRVDSLSYDGKNAPPASGGAAHKGYAVRAVLDAKGIVPCVTCAVSAWDDMAYYTPISGGSFAMPVFALTPDYAGRTISVDIFDPGDVNSSGTVDMSILGPSLTGQGCGTTAATPTPPQTVTVLDFGAARASPSPALISSPPTATFRATTNGNHPYNGHWVEMRIPVPSGYSPGTWCLLYTISTGGVSSDTLTLAVGLEGNPAHLVSG